MDINFFERPKIIEVLAKDLTLSKTNPRFPKHVLSEEEAILTFFRLKKVGPKKILSIIRDIIENRAVLNDFIVLQKDDEYIVYDGNRRLTALKLFINNNSDIIKDEFPTAYRQINNLKSEFDISSLPLYAKVYTDPESMANHVIKIHSGEQQGIGQIDWESNEIDTFASQFFDKPMNIGNLIYKKLEQSIIRQGLYEKIKDKGYATTFDRIFNFSDIKNRIFNLKRGEKINLEDDGHFEKVCEMVDYFVTQNANVTNVYLKDKAVTFFNHILPIDSSLPQHPRQIPDPEPTPEPEPKPLPVPMPSPKPETFPEPGPTTEPEPESYEVFLELKTQRQKVIVYNDFNLLSLVTRASDTKNVNLFSKVVFHTIPNRLISGSIFSGDAPTGTYHIQAKLENNGKSISKSITIEVILPKEKIITGEPKNDLFTSITAFASGNVKIDINYTVNRLINEIQSLEDTEKYTFMIASSVRQLMELSTMMVIYNKQLKDHGNPKDNLKFLLEKHLIENKLLKDICTSDNQLKYQATKNLLVSINAEKLYNYLNLITHDSSASIYSELNEKINKQITPILVVFHNYLKLT